MTLVDRQIRNLGETGMIQPFNPDLVNPTSYDITLGPNMLIETVEHDLMIPYPFYNHSIDNPYLVKPGEFFLVDSEQFFNIPRDLTAQFQLKSTTARGALNFLTYGLDHLKAGFCDPGWHGSRLTMEFKNVRQLRSIKIWPGMRVGQLVFTRTEMLPERDYSITGRYNNDKNVQGPKP